MIDNTNEILGAILASKVWQTTIQKTHIHLVAPSVLTMEVPNLPMKLASNPPDWWSEFQARKRRDSSGTSNNQGKTVVAISEPHLSLIPAASIDHTQGNTLLCSNHVGDRNAWILDSRATDHMTFDATDFSKHSTPQCTNIANAKGGISSVTRTETNIFSKEIIGHATKWGTLLYGGVKCRQSTSHVSPQVTKKGNRFFFGTVNLAILHLDT
ncbi:hypothetical protein CR513_49847, partial [Mucuna pruriens]